MTSRQTIAVLGGNGFLGSNLTKYFLNLGFNVQSISKENYSNFTGKHFDIFINANGNSKKFWANQNPELDFEASVSSVKKSLSNFKFDHYVFISSSDVYPNHNQPNLSLEDSSIKSENLDTYGLHKYQAEVLVQSLPSYFILRCCAMVGPGLKKGVIKDILNDGDLFISKDSALQFITTEEVARVIYELLQLKMKNQIFNCAGEGSVTVEQMFEVLGKHCRIRSDAKKQDYNISVKKLNNLLKLKSSKDYLIDFVNEGIA